MGFVLVFSHKFSPAASFVCMVGGRMGGKE